MRPVILFVDLLGARKKWQEGGVDSATAAFKQFSRLVIATFRTVGSSSIIRGGIETDAAMFVFDSATSALNAASTLFHAAFRIEKNERYPRLWLRGSLVLDGDADYVRKESRASGSLSQINITTYSKEALDSISIEKSGFKGMRLLIKNDVIDDELRENLKFDYGTHYFIPIKELRYSAYPKVNGDKFSDFLWMAKKDEEEWRNIALYMAYRLRYSANNPEEFAQAAATQVAFHQCAALRRSVISRVVRKQCHGITQTETTDDVI